MGIKVLSIKEKIKEFLTGNKHLRDNDDKLAANIWYNECRKLGIEPPMEFLKLMAESKITNYESIRRCRAKLQEKYPELRGEVYNKRHGLQIEVIKDLHKV